MSGRLSRKKAIALRSASFSGYPIAITFAIQKINRLLLSVTDATYHTLTLHLSDCLLEMPFAHRRGHKIKMSGKEAQCMQPKFPGMNPYLENPELWSEVHFGLISVLARSLNAVITPKYRAAVEKRVYSDSLLVGIPDVSVFQRDAEAAEFQRTTATLSEPLVVTVPVVEETQERFLEIREVGTVVTVVTVVEVLSPKNKRAGEGKVKYDAKRQAVLNSTANLVEIDLLRTGEPKPMAGGVASDYRILVSRVNRRPAAELYPFNLREPLPRFLLPLRPSDREPVVDLQVVLQQVYQEAALDLAIDYTQPPIPPVSDDDFAWIQSLQMN